MAKDAKKQKPVTLEDVEKKAAVALWLVGAERALARGTLGPEGALPLPQLPSPELVLPATLRMAS